MKLRCSAWPSLTLAALLAGCGGSSAGPAPRNVTHDQTKREQTRKELNRARRVVKARKENTGGGVELAAFAQELQRLTLDADRPGIEALFLDPKAVDACTFTRDEGAEALPTAALAEFIDRRRAGIERLTAIPEATVVALVHKLRPRKRLMGARIGGDACPIEARGRVNIVLQTGRPPPDAIENQYEAAFVGGRWWAVSFERTERDCSDLGAPEAFGCRALRSASGEEPQPSVTE